MELKLNINEIAAQFDISESEAERIDAKVDSIEDFIAVWGGESWWCDENGN